MILNGILQKLKSRPHNPVEYYLSLGDKEICLNEFLGKELRFEFSGGGVCIHCQRQTKKLFQQGYCFVCAQSLARCDICMVRPEKCHHEKGTCREPEWAQTHCFIPHIIYLANTSQLKIGITRENQVPTRWIDQGATQALPIARVSSRLEAGLLEIQLAKLFPDKTDWRKMLKGSNESLNLTEHQKDLKEIVTKTNQNVVWLNETIQNFHYPVLSYPQKIHSISIEKEPHFSSTLLGIKGQYLIFEKGVMNCRNLSGSLFQMLV